MNEKEALLKQLRDVELPEVSGVPALGWWLLMLLVILLFVAAWFYYRRWRTRLWQRQAQIELQRIRSQLGDVPTSATLSRCSLLARKVVLAADHREKVAALHGQQWIEKLDDICGHQEFSQSSGQLLLDQPYQKQPVIAEEGLNALFDSMQVLIKSAGNYRSADQPSPDTTGKKKPST